MAVVAPAPAPSPAPAPPAAAPAPAPTPQQIADDVTFSFDAPPAEPGTPAPAPAAAPAPAPETPPAEPPADPLARARDDIARRDRELIVAQAEVRAQQRTLEEYQALRELAASDPLGAMRRLGGDPLAAAEAMLTPKPPPDPAASIKSMEQQLAEMRAELQQERQTRSQQEAMGVQLSRIRQTLDAQAEAFPVVRRLVVDNPRIIEGVLQAAAAEYQQTQRPPDYGAILAAQEREFTSNILASISQVLGVPSIRQGLQAALSPPPTAAPAATSQPPAHAPATPAGPGKAITQQTPTDARVGTRQSTIEEADAAAKEILGQWLTAAPAE